MAINRVKRKVDGKIKWVYVFDTRINGERKRTPRTSYFLTYGECEAALEALRTDDRRKRYGLAQQEIKHVTLEELKVAWIQSLTINQRAKSYIQRAERIMNTFIKVSSTQNVDEVGFKDIQAFAQAELSREQDEGTVKAEMTCLMVGLRAASFLFNELQNYRPPQKPKLGLEESARTRVITKDEEKQIIAAYLTKRNRENWRYAKAREQGAKIFWLALRTGMRAGEIMALKRTSVIFDSTPSYPSGFIIVQEGRTGKTKTGKTRLIPMSPTLADVLKEQLASHALDNVFPSIETGQQIGQFYTALKAACKIANIPYGRELAGGIVFHDTRHTAATRMLEAGIPLKEVAEILGHANTTMTLRYAHTSTATKQKAILALDSDISPRPVEYQTGGIRENIENKATAATAD